MDKRQQQLIRIKCQAILLNPEYDGTVNQYYSSKDEKLKDFLRYYIQEIFDIRFPVRPYTISYYLKHKDWAFLKSILILPLDDNPIQVICGTKTEEEFNKILDYVKKEKGEEYKDFINRAKYEKPIEITIRINLQRNKTLIKQAVNDLLTKKFKTSKKHKNSNLDCLERCLKIYDAKKKSRKTFEKLAEKFRTNPNESNPVRQIIRDYKKAEDIIKGGHKYLR